MPKTYLIPMFAVVVAESELDADEKVAANACGLRNGVAVYFDEELPTVEMPMHGDFHSIFDAFTGENGQDCLCLMPSTNTTTTTGA